MQVLYNESSYLTLLPKRQGVLLGQVLRYHVFGRQLVRSLSNEQKHEQEVLCRIPHGYEKPNGVYITIMNYDPIRLKQGQQVLVG